MALTKAHENLVWLGGAAVLIAVLFWLVKRAQSSAGTSGVGYTNYNAPATRNWSGGSSGLPSVVAPPAGTDCGCTSSGGGAFFVSLQDMLNQFSAGATAAFNSYENNVYSSLPDLVTQYFNNPAGAGQYQASQQILTMPGNGSNNQTP